MTLSHHLVKCYISVIFLKNKKSLKKTLILATQRDYYLAAEIEGLKVLLLLNK